MSAKSEAARSATQKELEFAINRIKEGKSRVVPVGSRLSIAAVAKEAGVSNATIHNRYPDVANAIRKLVMGTYAEQLESKRGNLKECQSKLALARKEIDQLKEDLSRSQSINLRLQKDIELLRNKISYDFGPT